MVVHLWIKIFTKYLIKQRLNNAFQLLFWILAQFKVIISDAKGKSQVQEIKDVAAQPFLGSKIGDSIDSSTVGITAARSKLLEEAIGQVANTAPIYTAVSRNMCYCQRELVCAISKMVIESESW